MELVSLLSPLIAALGARDPAVTPGEPIPSFERLYDEHVDFAWRSARRLGVDELGADDVVQQTFLVVHRRLAEFEGKSSLKTWIFSILLRVVQEHRRSIRRKSPHMLHGSVDPDDIADGMTNPHEALERAEASRAIDLLLETLEGDKRAIFVMAELEEMTADEIGHVTGLDRQAVYSRLRAARIDFERAAERMRRQQRREEREAR